MDMSEKLEILWWYQITMIRWLTDWKHWRVWLNREDARRYDFIVEKPTVEECIDECIKYHNENNLMPTE